MSRVSRRPYIMMGDAAGAWGSWGGKGSPNPEPCPEPTGPEYWRRWEGMVYRWPGASREYMGFKAETTLLSVGEPNILGQCELTFEDVWSLNVRGPAFHPAITTGFAVGALAVDSVWYQEGNVNMMPLHPGMGNFATMEWVGPSTSGTCTFMLAASPVVTAPSDPSNPTMASNSLKTVEFSAGSYPTQTGVHTFTRVRSVSRVLNLP